MFDPITIPSDSDGGFTADAELQRSGDEAKAPWFASVRLLGTHLLEADTPTDTAALRELFDSILRWGILQPLIVRPSRDRYEVLAGRKRLAAAVAAGFSDVPCLVFEGPAGEAAALTAATNAARGMEPRPAIAANAPFTGVIEALQASRAAIVASLALADAPGSGLRQQVARQLAEVELQRTAWMLDALSIANAAAPESAGPVHVGTLLRSVAAVFKSECRLAGISVRLNVNPGDLTVSGNDVQLRAALQCLLGAMLVSMDAARSAQGEMTIDARADAGGAVLSIAQNVVPLHLFAALRAGAKRGEAQRGDTAAASFALDATRHLVEAFGGRLELRPDPSTEGCAFDLRLPAWTGSPDEQPGWPAFPA